MIREGRWGGGGMGEPVRFGDPSAEGCSRIRVEGRVNARRGGADEFARAAATPRQRQWIHEGTRNTGAHRWTGGHARAAGRVSMFVIA